MSESFRAPRHALLRLWHWGNAGLIFAMLGTVFLRENWMSWRTNAPVIVAKAAEAGVTVPAEAAEAAAKAIRDPMWEWHYTLGFVLAGLFVARAVTALLDPQPGPLRKAIAALRAGAYGHALAVHLLYALFYVFLAFMLTSGLALYFRDSIGLAGEARGAVKEAHELVMNFFPAFVLLHVVGVVVAELRGDRGLVSGMIHGDAEA